MVRGAQYRMGLLCVRLPRTSFAVSPLSALVTLPPPPPVLFPVPPDFLCFSCACPHVQVQGHSVIFLHVDVANVNAINFYKRLGFQQQTRDVTWYKRIGREDMSEQDQIVMYKLLDSNLHSLKDGKAIQDDDLSLQE
mmetsp:Transcript_45694/g.143428  ORF Transcript_45694/g.143428 Transcript_45694/m.143428 type:complete len:137 (+) Transcript_45694:682-1092(+)